MSQITFDLLETPDSALVAAFKGVCPELPEATEMVLEWTVAEGAPVQVIPIGQLDQNEAVKRAVDSGIAVCRRICLTFVVGGQQGRIVLDRPPDGRTSFLANLPPAWDRDIVVLTDVTLAIHGAFGPFAKSKALESFAPAMSEFYATRDSTLVRLEELNAKLTRENDKYRRKLDEQYEARLAALDAQFEAKRAQLDAGYESKDAALKEKTEELDERKRTLDDRDNTHARRQIQKDLKDEFKGSSTKFSLTRDTVRKRYPITAAFVTLVGALAAVAAWSFHLTTMPPVQGQEAWLPIVRFALSLAAFGSSVVFYIKWEDRWSEAHSSEEFRLKRLALDMDRASWLVETMLGWPAETGLSADIRKELIERLANGLFAQQAGNAPVRHPAEEMIGALLASSSSVNLDLPGGQAKLDRKGIAQLKKTPE